MAATAAPDTRRSVASITTAWASEPSPWPTSSRPRPAAVRRDVAEQAVAQLPDRAKPAGTLWARGLLLRSRALVATGEEGDDLFRAALDELARSTLATEQARTSLLYGEWLRRARRRRDAR